MLDASQRAARLTSQLLAFSRGQVVRPRRLDLNAVVRGAEGMLRPLIPSNVAFSLELAEGLAPVLADQGQVEQVLVNLTVNAADAMPSGGRLTIRTTTSEMEDHGASGQVPARRYVQLTVKDTGVGMDRETRARIFEPFFTTKRPGKGTGLGLATVHGIVTELGGQVHLYSEPGLGATFKLFFPVATGPAQSVPERESASAAPPRASGTILLVEDDPLTRGATRRLLLHHGYDVVAAARGDDAIARLRERPGAIHAVLSDVMMPGMSGPELAAHIAEEWPGLPVVLMSGYADADLRATFRAAITGRIVEKPFSSATLLRALGEALGRT
jgi:CheY-like chemotaxis protein